MLSDPSQDSPSLEVPLHDIFHCYSITCTKFKGIFASDLHDCTVHATIIMRSMTSSHTAIFLYDTH